MIYLSLSGYGQTGPYRDRACSDTVAQAFAGFIASNTGVDGIPHRVNTIPADIAGGLYAFQAISVALFRRTRTGRGGYIDLSLTQAMAHFQGVKFAEYKIEDGAPSALTSRLATIWQPMGGSSSPWSRRKVSRPFARLWTCPN